MTTKPLYIFDLDGTLALIEHRKHLISNGNNKWDDFYKACIDDQPNIPVLTLFNQLRDLQEATYCNDHMNDVWVWSGRSEIARLETKLWLLQKTGFLKDKSYEDQDILLKMRPENDYTPDEQVKEKWLLELPQEDRNRLVCVFDDRQKVVDMWRRNGVTCLQVAPGNF